MTYNNESFQSESDFIIGGRPIDISRVPYQASLRYQLEHICGASIISRRHCLTAAHCYESMTFHRDYSILVGTQFMSGRGQNTFWTPVARYIQHPSYDTETSANDIAVLMLQNLLPLNGRTIAAIPLPTQNAPLQAGQWGLISGW